MLESCKNESVSYSKKESRIWMEVQVEINSVRRFCVCSPQRSVTRVLEVCPMLPWSTAVSPSHSHTQCCLIWEPPRADLFMLHKTLGFLYTSYVMGLVEYIYIYINIYYITLTLIGRTCLTCTTMNFTDGCSFICEIESLNQTTSMGCRVRFVP